MFQPHIEKRHAAFLAQINKFRQMAQVSFRALIQHR
jgi:hypothetical protein